MTQAEDRAAERVEKAEAINVEVARRLAQPLVEGVKESAAAPRKSRKKSADD